jgi:hypothetical protein
MTREEYYEDKYQSRIQSAYEHGEEVGLRFSEIEISLDYIRSGYITLEQAAKRLDFPKSELEDYLHNGMPQIGLQCDVERFDRVNELIKIYRELM